MKRGGRDSVDDLKINIESAIKEKREGKEEKEILDRSYYVEATRRARGRNVVEIVGANRRRKKNGKSNFSGGACRLQVGRWTTCAATCKREATRPFDHLVARARHMRPSHRVSPSRFRY